MATSLKKINTIHSLIDDNNIELSLSMLHSHISHFYEKLFMSKNVKVHIDDLKFVQSKFSANMNEQFSHSNKQNEILQAIRQMHLLKAPSPNGLPPLFYKKYWLVVGDDVCDLVQHILKADEFPINLNQTFYEFDFEN